MCWGKNCHLNSISSFIQKKSFRRKINGIDDRGSGHPPGDQIKVVMEIRSEQQGKITWDLDEQAIQLGRSPRKHPGRAAGRTGQGHGAAHPEQLRQRLQQWQMPLKGTVTSSGFSR